MQCPNCNKGTLYKAFTCEGDIGWCLKCDYRTPPDRSWIPKSIPVDDDYGEMD